MFYTQASANQFSAAPHTSRAATTSTRQACLPLLAAMHSASCGRQWPATSSLPYSFVLAAQLLDQAVAEDDGLACSRETDGARETEAALSTRRWLWMVKGLRSPGLRLRSKKRGTTGRGGRGRDGCGRRLTKGRLLTMISCPAGVFLITS